MASSQSNSSIVGNRKDANTNQNSASVREPFFTQGSQRSAEAQSNRTTSDGQLKVTNPNFKRRKFVILVNFESCGIAAKVTLKSHLNRMFEDWNYTLLHSLR